MELIVFDLDGTLLDATSKISAYTRETLIRLSDRGVLYTVATGRALHASRDILEGHAFHLPQAYKNGVLIWNPTARDYTHHNFLTLPEIQHVLEAVLAQGVTPFMFTLEAGNRHGIYHPPPGSRAEEQLAESFRSRRDVRVLPASAMPAEAEITNVSALGNARAIDTVALLIQDEPGLVAYYGPAIEGDGLKWIDIHHKGASKGSAVDVLRRELGANSVVCFGDSDNDLSMFATADEAYAPENASAEVRAAATAVIGHHDQDGIARFLRERFDLD
jgi:Cof subfamily protein (haloacid dehalogenase superfamily)